MLGSNKYRWIRVPAMVLGAIMSILISCSSPEEVGPENENSTVSPQEIPIGFRHDALSRAVDLSTVCDDFCVHAVKTNADGTKSLVIPDYLVKHIDGRWIYSGETNIDGTTQYLKYWDLSANSYTFAGVAPAPATTSEFSINNDGLITINLDDLSTNRMIARTVRLGVNDDTSLIDFDDIAEDIADIDKSTGKTSAVFPLPNAPHADVPLRFHSILAKVVIKAYAESETLLSPLEVGLNNLGIAPATYSSATGWETTQADYQQFYNRNTLITNEQNSRETAQQLTEFYVIPQQTTDASNNSLVQIKVTMDNDDARVHLFGIPDLWEPDYTYIYYLKFESGETGEIILFDVAVEPMAKGGDADDVQTNW